MKKKLTIRTFSVDPANTFSDERLAWFTDRMVLATQSHVIQVNNVKDFVTKLRAFASRGQIQRLIHMGHGLPAALDFGRDSVQNATWSEFSPYFETLRGYFCRGGYVHIQNCYAGRDEVLLKKIAFAVGVPVWAGTDQENPVLHRNAGDYSAAFPNGQIVKNLHRPQPGGLTGQ